jgi:hypothetical protein
MISPIHSAKIQRILLVTFMLAITGCGLVPKSKMTAADVPLGFGTTYEAYQNKGMIEGVAVKSDLQGPWDFTAAGNDAIVKSTLVKVSQATDYKLFTSASYAEKVLPSDFTGGFTSFNFGAISDKALFVYGQSVTSVDKEAKVKVYAHPERLLVFPLAVGTSWSDVVTVQGSPPTTFDIARRVVARGEVKTPAGDFVDCFMVRAIKQAREPGAVATRTVMYTWWAPGVGPVAAIGGQPGEATLTLKEADYMFRLKSYKVSH